MGWDVMILNTRGILPDAKIETSFPAFGQRQILIDRLNKLFPQLEWDSDFAYGHLDTQDYMGNIGIGEDEIVDGVFWLGVYGGANPLKVITTLCSEFNSSAYDTVTSEYITIDKPSDKGWKHFQNFRGYVAKHVVAVDNEKSEEK